MSEKRSSTKTSKVQRVIDDYGLTDLGDRLEAHWLGDADEQYSLRQLADLFNQEVLRAALTEAGVSTLDGEIENTHRLLTSNGVSSGVRTETENALARDGIDVERLKRDFVSHQAVHTYLTKYRSVSYKSQIDEPTAQLEKDASTIQRLRNRTAAVTETTLNNLRNTNRITLGDFELFVDLRVVCNTCDQSYPVDELLREGGCDCAAKID